MFSFVKVSLGSKSKCTCDPFKGLEDDQSDCHCSMKGYDPEGQVGPRKPLPDSVQIHEPPVDKIIAEPTSEQREPAAPQAAPVLDDATYQQPQEAYDQGGGYEQSGF